MYILMKLLNGLVSDINLWRPTFDTIFECFTWILHLSRAVAKCPSSG